MLKFKIHFEGRDAIEDKLGANCTIAEETVARHVMKDTAKFVPFRNGIMEMRTEVIKTKDGAGVYYPKPYARYLYFGKLMVDPATGSSWVSEGKHKVETDRNLVFSRAHNSQAQSHWFEVSKAVNLNRWLGEAERELKRHGSTK